MKALVLRLALTGSLSIVLALAITGNSNAQTVTPKLLHAQQPVPETPGAAPSLQPQPPGSTEPSFRPKFLPLRARSRSGPSITVLVPSAYGRSWRSAAVGVGFQSRTRFRDNADGAVGVSVGFGDARKAVGLDVGVTAFNFSGTARGSVSLKLHRLLPEDVAIAAGVSNIISLGDWDGSVSPYGVVTKRFRLANDTRVPFSQVYVSAGVGGGRFRLEDDYNAGRDTVGAFGSVAVRVVEPMSVIAEWSGQDLSMGVSIAPSRKIPLVITPAVVDITGSAGDGPRFILGIGYGISY